MSLRKKDPERPPRVAFGLYKRAILGIFVIILATATAGSAAVLLTVEKAVDIIKKNEGGHAIKLSHGTITAAEAGKAQTLLVLGSDHRFTDPKSAKGFSKPREARSDTIMLIHLDPHAAATTVLSIPRDLKVEIPGHGFDKINAAYSIGGPDLVVRTVKKLLGPQVKVNHVINVQFNGFQRAVNYLHGVYVDVDQFYYHSNAGLAPSQQYSEINVKPGYQKLVGSDALAYVRYRHTDSDFIRADRQQDFLRQVKDQVGESKLIDELFPLLDVVSRDMQFDSTFTKKYGILDLLRLAAFSTKNPIQQVKFPNGADVNDGKAQFVVVDAAAIPGVVRSFLHPARVQKRTVSVGGGGGSSSASSSKSSSKSKKTHKKKKKHETPSTLAPGLIKATAEMQNAAAPVIARGKVDVPVLPAIGDPRRDRPGVLHIAQDRQPVRVQAVRPQRRQEAPARAPAQRLPVRIRRQQPAGRLLRRRGYELAQPTDHRQPHPDGDAGRPQAHVLHERRQAAVRRMEDQARRLLGLQYARLRADQQADGGYCAVVDALRLSVRDRPSPGA